MNDEEWVLEFYNQYKPPPYQGGWEKCFLYEYDKLLGVIDKFGVRMWHDNPEKDQYRLRHIPTGKIIPGELL